MNVVSERTVDDAWLLVQHVTGPAARRSCLNVKTQDVVIPSDPSGVLCQEEFVFLVVNNVKNIGVFYGGYEECALGEGPLRGSSSPFLGL